jgi:hypothetical protein
LNATITLIDQNISHRTANVFIRLSYNKRNKPTFPGACGRPSGHTMLITCWTKVWNSPAKYIVVRDYETARLLPVSWNKADLLQQKLCCMKTNEVEELLKKIKVKHAVPEYVNIVVSGSHQKTKRRQHDDLMSR